MHPIERLRFVARGQGDDTALTVEAASALAGFAHDPPGLVVACRRLVERHPANGQMWALCSRLLAVADPSAEARRTARELVDDPTSKRLRDALPMGATVVSFASAAVMWPALEGRADVRVLLVGDHDPSRHEVMGERLRRRSRAVDPFDADSSAEGLAGAADESGRLEEVGLVGVAAAIAEADVVVLRSVVSSDSAFVVPLGSVTVAAAARHLGVDVWVAAPACTMLPPLLWKAAVEAAVPAVGGWRAEYERLGCELVTSVVGPTGLHDVATAGQRVDCPASPGLLR